jgi:hypothetical protein
LRERGWILSRIFPFDLFLCLQKKIALRRFRQACGLGKIEKFSGQVAAGKSGSRWTGCSNTRSILWTYVDNPIELEIASRSSVQSKLREFDVGCSLECQRDEKERPPSGRRPQRYLSQTGGFIVSGDLPGF